MAIVHTCVSPLEMLLVSPFEVQLLNGCKGMASSLRAKTRLVWRWVCRLGNEKDSEKPANREMVTGKEWQRASLAGMVRHLAEKEGQRARLVGLVLHKVDLEASLAARRPQCVMRALTVK